jgi:hypothetical protein
VATDRDSIPELVELGLGRAPELRVERVRHDPEACGDLPPQDFHPAFDPALFGNGLEARVAVPLQEVAESDAISHAGVEQSLHRDGIPQDSTRFELVTGHASDHRLPGPVDLHPTWACQANDPDEASAMRKGKKSTWPWGLRRRASRAA